MFPIECKDSIFRWMHLGNENKKHFLFCIPLGFHFFDFAVEDRMHLGNENKKTFLFCIPLGFHYLCHQKCKKTVN